MAEITSRHHAFIAAGPRHDASKLFPPFSVAIEFRVRPTLRIRETDLYVCFLQRHVNLVAGMTNTATHSKIESDNRIEMGNTNRCRIFLLSPAYAGGERARMILSDRAEFELAQKLRSKRGAPIAKVFTFLSGLYFRGKIAYAAAFARPAPGIPG